MDETATERQKPEKGQKDGDSCNDLGIDKAGYWISAVALTTDAIEIGTRDTSYYGCKSKLKDSQYLLGKGWLFGITYLAEAEGHTEEIVYEMHLGYDFLIGLTVCRILMYLEDEEEV